MSEPDYGRITGRSEYNLLFPEGPDVSTTELPPETIRDLEIDFLVSEFGFPGKELHKYDSIFKTIVRCGKTLRERQSVLSDLLRSPELDEVMRTILPELEKLVAYRAKNFLEHSELFAVARRISELECYTVCVKMLSDALADAEPESIGLRKIREKADAVRTDPAFNVLRKELPVFRSRILNIAGITIGINLNGRLEPSEACLLSIETKKFTGRNSSIVGRLFSEDGVAEGMTRLHSAVTDNPAYEPLFRDLARLCDQVARPLAKRLRAFIGIEIDWLLDLREDISFFCRAAAFTRRLLEAGFPVCRPEILPESERLLRVRNGYNVNFALRCLNEEPAASKSRVVPNDIEMDASSGISILTGPNRGGKTVYLQSVGLTQVLAQIGLFVPGESASVSIVDGIYTHYQTDERTETDTGRFGDEMTRFAAIFDSITPFSLFLFNESLASTSTGEGLYVAVDIVKSLRLLGSRGIYTTHMHELAEKADCINKEIAGTSIVTSLVAGIIEDNTSSDLTRTFRIVKSRPRGRSYASETAARFGIDFGSLSPRLLSRAVRQP